MNVDKIAWQPCNPAIGGPAKSQLVHEVDSLGGEIGRMADLSYLQKRVLNASCGPSVWSLRAQTDKQEYSRLMKKVLDSTHNIQIKESQVVDIEVNANDEIVGVVTYFGIVYPCKCVILTTGTFLKGRIWVGKKTLIAGRATEDSCTTLTYSLERLGFKIDRLKTGTPSRVDKKTINFRVLEEQVGDSQTRWFSSDTSVHKEREQLSCFLTRTTGLTHKIIKENLNETPKYGGWVSAEGPRHCPSIEDKIVKFPNKTSHQVFLEPESKETTEIYVQGLSTGLTERLQLAILRTLPGLEEVRIIRPAYAVEYEFIPAKQCTKSLETKRIKGLFLGGQLNGTTGYEEASAQGLIAGINAARRVMNLAAFTIDRDSSYIATLIDDLTTKELREPYRMLTSHSEHRLSLRSDNSDVRLMPLGRMLGLIDDRRWTSFKEKQTRVDKEISRLRTTRIHISHPIIAEVASLSMQDNVSKTIFALDELIRRPLVQYSHLDQFNKLANSDLTGEEKECVEIRIKYEGFIGRQNKNHGISFRNKRVNS
jgi:tRNA uridine 5-carboxymethylaminomethyl modification enzyme